MSMSTRNVRRLLIIAALVAMFASAFISLPPSLALLTTRQQQLTVSQKQPTPTNYHQKPNQLKPLNIGPSCDDPDWPDLELFVTMIERDLEEFDTNLLRSLKFFWPKKHLRLVIVLDQETKSQRFEDYVLELASPVAKEVRVVYNAPSEYYGKSGHDRQQLLMLQAFQFTSAEFVGFLDTDTFFVSPVDVHDLFQDGKPVMIGAMYVPPENTFWTKPPYATGHLLGQPEVLHGMTFFPFIMKTAHLNDLCQFVNITHGIDMNEYFLQGIKRWGTKYSQFNWMMNYVWYHQRDDYVWRIQQHEKAFLEGQRGTNYLLPYTSQPQNRTPASQHGFTEDMFLPHPRVSLHATYEIHRRRFGTKWEKMYLATGYCYEALLHNKAEEKIGMATALVNVSNWCQQVFLLLGNMEAPSTYMFLFEYHSWEYHPQAKSVFEERQARRRLCPMHSFPSDVLHELPSDWSEVNFSKLEQPLLPTVLHQRQFNWSTVDLKKANRSIKADKV